MRIAFISPFSPLKGGISRFSGLLADELQSKGHAVRRLGFKKLYPSFLAGGHAPEAPEQTSAASQGTPDTASNSKQDAVSVASVHSAASAQSASGAASAQSASGAASESKQDAVSVASEKSAASAITLYNPLTWFALLRNLKRERPEVLLVAYWTGLLAPLLFMIRKLSGIPSVVLLHNLSTHEPILFEPLMRKLLFASADGFITLSREVTGALALAGNTKPVWEGYHPVYHPFCTVHPKRTDARKRLGCSDNAPLLLFFGYVRRYKGLDLLLQAMPAVLAVLPEAKLLVAGQFYEPESRYRELAGRLGIGKSVDFRSGYASDTDAAQYFAAADVVLLPYRQATQSGVVQLAYGYGRPVIVTPVGGLAEAVTQGKTGVIAADTTPGAIAAAVIGFFGNENRDDVSRYLRDYVNDHAWERFAGGAAAFIQTAVRS